MLTAIAPDLWHVEHDQHLPGGFHMPTRMVVARLPDGSLWLHSCVPISQDLAQQLADLGPVEHIVVPNMLHTLYAQAASARYPQAATYGPAGLPKKLPDLNNFQALTDTPPPPWGQAFLQQTIHGAPMVQEVVFFHRASGSLVVADLVFNQHKGDSLLTRVILRMAGAWQRFAQSRSWRFLFVKDRAAAAAAIHTVLGWDTQRVVMSHGELLEAPVKQSLARALAWMAGPKQLTGAHSH